MNILLMSGSPKRRNSSDESKSESASRSILSQSGQLIGARAEQEKIDCTMVNAHALDADIVQKAAACDVLVMAFPLYVDGIPSHLLSVMEKMERDGVVSANTRIYAIVNCGFIEGEHCLPALEMTKHWCARCGAVWGGGLGFGGGGGLDMMESVPLGYGPKKTLGQEINLIVDDIFGGSGTGMRYARVNFPAFMYKLGGQSGWRMMAKANGLRRRDLSKRL